MGLSFGFKFVLILDDDEEDNILGLIFEFFSYSFSDDVHEFFWVWL